MSQTLPEKKQATTPTRTTDVETVFERMREILDETFGGFAPLPFLGYAARWSPPVDVEETDGAYVLEAELPGVDKKDIEIELLGNELLISGEVKEKERMGIVRRQTRRSGQFSYRLTLPERPDVDGVEASLKDGVLKVTVPKAAPAERRKVELKS